MTKEDAIKHLDNMKWLLGVNNTTVDDIPLTKVIDDIIALLKEQEPEAVIRSKDYIEGLITRCPKCKNKIYKYNGCYCPTCGKAVKWE